MCFLFFPGVLFGQCPNTPSPHFSCTSAGGNTQITLFADAELAWDSFSVPAGGLMDISSAGASPFSSRHIVAGRATIAGGVTADGGFTLVAPRGITHAGTITAPNVTLSTLEATGPDSYLSNSNVRNLELRGQVMATDGNVTLLGKDVRITGELMALEGKVTLISTASEQVSGSGFVVSPGPVPPRRFSQGTSRGNMEAPVVEIYTEGTFTNSGRIAGDTVILSTKGRIVHENRPGAVIEAENLIVNNLTTGSGVIIEGEVIVPDDGINPGGVSTTLGFPDLESGSFSSKKQTRLLPTQFSASNVSQARLPSAVAKKKKSSVAKSRVATRGKAAKSKRKSKKRSGVVTKK